jgi:hypothetical protein
MAQVKAMWIGQGASNLPEDQYVNTFHFITPNGYETDKVLVTEALLDFYAEVGGYIQGYVQRASEIRTYDLTTGTPRVPFTTTCVLPSTVQAGGLPEECAVCLSYHGSPPVTPSRRGRIYIGPLVPGVVDAATTSEPARVGATFNSVLRSAAVALAGAGVGWSIYSPATGLFVTILGGWVDNAVDIIRKRGGDPTVRVVWTAP